MYVVSVLLLEEPSFLQTTKILEEGILRNALHAVNLLGQRAISSQRTVCGAWAEGIATTEPVVGSHGRNRQSLDGGSSPLLGGRVGVGGKVEEVNPLWSFHVGHALFLIHFGS